VNRCLHGNFFGCSLKVLIELAILLLLFSVGCSSNKESSSKKIECQAPSNPYEMESGHHAGFEWAHENGGACDGNSDSFNEGCNEYYSQKSSYDNCMSEAKQE
jgi:hypothetical protein